MDNKEKSLYRNVVKYDAKRAYFGKLTAEHLDSAYGLFKHTQNWDKPVKVVSVTVGKIDGGIICRALWHEMSYNPKRFGFVSPFLCNGKESMYRFCDKRVPETTPGFVIVDELRHKMIDFMTLNSRPNGSWNDVISTDNGIVRMRLIDGHSDNNYKILTKLREMIRLVTTQNSQDFKRAKYRTEMLKVINERHPDGMRGRGQMIQQSKPSNIPESMTTEEMEEDRLDRALESAQITLDCQQYVPLEQYEQAQQEISYINQTKANMYQK